MHGICIILTLCLFSVSKMVKIDLFLFYKILKNSCISSFYEKIVQFMLIDVYSNLTVYSPRFVTGHYIKF